MAEELVDIVDENNNVINTVVRSEMRKFKLPHRATYIVIKNSDNKYYIQKRTMTKDYCPGMLDACTGGVLSSKENYDFGAKRELFEEMGIKSENLTFCGIHKLGSAKEFVFGGLYFTVYDGPIIKQESEVEEVLLMTLKEIMSRVNEFTPDSIEAFLIILKETNQKI